MKDELESIEQAFEKTLESNQSDATKLAMICIQFVGLTQAMAAAIGAVEILGGGQK